MVKYPCWSTMQSCQRSINSQLSLSVQLMNMLHTHSNTRLITAWPRAPTQSKTKQESLFKCGADLHIQPGLLHQQRHSFKCTACPEVHDGLHGPQTRHSLARQRGRPQAFCGWEPGMASLTPASCWVIASSDGRGWYRNGVSPSVFSHTPPSARVIVMFLCKTPCKSGNFRIFFFFLL